MNAECRRSNLGTNLHRNQLKTPACSGAVIPVGAADDTSPMNMTEQNMARAIELPSNRDFLISIGRAFAGALLFALPILMTMEMWELGVSLDPWRVALLLIAVVPLLLGLSRYSGIRYTAHWRDEVADVLVAILISTFTRPYSSFGHSASYLPTCRLAKSFPSWRCNSFRAASGPCWLEAS
jgi:uncharacterized membrane protein